MSEAMSLAIRALAAVVLIVAIIRLLYKAAKKSRAMKGQAADIIKGAHVVVYDRGLTKKVDTRTSMTSSV